MAVCEMCGSDSHLVTAEIEGGELRVCNSCAKFGKVRAKVVPRVRYKRVEGPEFRVVRGYHRLIREARESRGLSQEEFASFLQEKESIVQKWENGILRPRVEIARALEKKLGVVLLEQMGGEAKPLPKVKNDVLTLGDFVKVRKRKG